MKLAPTTLRSLPWFLALVASLFWHTGHAGHHPGMSQTSGKALGVTISEVPFEPLAAADLDYGVRVMEVMPGSPAAAAGLKEDDIIVEIDGKPVYSVKRLQWLVRQAPEGTPVQFRLQREDRLETATVTFQPTQVSKSMGTAGPRVGPTGFGYHKDMNMRAYTPGSYLGVQFQPMTEQLRAALGAPTDKGVLVVAVAEEGPAKQAGLAVGDVIVRMDRKTISNMRDIYRVLAYFDAGDEIEVEVIREKAPLVVMANLGALPARMSHLPWHNPPSMYPYPRP